MERSQKPNTSARRKGGGSASVTATIYALAERQHGVVTRAQLLAAGISRGQINGRIQSGGLRPAHRGVYLVGPILPPLATVMAACLACGPTAVVSHRTAAGILGLLPSASPSEPIHIRVRRGKRRRSGVQVHQCRGMPDDETTVHDTIPITTPARTLLDLAATRTVRDRVLEQAFAKALGLEAITIAALRALVERHRRQPGTGRLRALLDAGDPAFTRSEAEERFLSLVRKAKLPKVKTNVRVAGHEVDFFWPAARLVVEIDGFPYHASRLSFEADRRRDADLAARGYRVVRVTWTQIERRSGELLFTLGRAFGSGRG